MSRINKIVEIVHSHHRLLHKGNFCESAKWRYKRYAGDDERMARGVMSDVRGRERV